MNTFTTTAFDSIDDIIDAFSKCGCTLINVRGARICVAPNGKGVLSSVWVTIGNPFLRKNAISIDGAPGMEFQTVESCALAICEAHCW